jgi:heat shock protein HtpX
MNYFKTFVLMVVLTGIFMLIGNYFGGMRGMEMAFGIAVLMNFFSYWFSDKIVLAMYGAKEIKREDNPELYVIVSNLATKAQLPMPKVYIVNEAMANAFATGRDPQHAAVAVTSGILDILTPRQLEAVLAHELTHVKNRDILISTIAATLAAAIMMTARFAMFFGGGSRDNDRGGAVGMILLMILAPIAALLVQMAISRSREYAADNGSAEITGRPQELISALEALTAGVKRNPAGAEVQPSTAHMFIVNPFSGDFLASLFSTHPTLAQRKANLEKFGKSI